MIASEKLAAAITEKLAGLGTPSDIDTVMRELRDQHPDLFNAYREELLEEAGYEIQHSHDNSGDAEFFSAAPAPASEESKQQYLKRCTIQFQDTGTSERDALSACNDRWARENEVGELALQRPLEFSKNDQGRRKFAIVGYTGQELETATGKVLIDISGIQTRPRLPVLREHRRDRVVGFGEAWTDAKNLYVSGDFSASTPDAKEVLALADEGYPWQASVGIWPMKKRFIGAGADTEVNGRRIEGPVSIWEKSHVAEVSFVSLGADGRTAAVAFSKSTSESTDITPEADPEEALRQELKAATTPPDPSRQRCELESELRDEIKATLEEFCGR